MRTALPTAKSENAAAETYVRLVLALGQHDTNFVDAYYGPPEWRTEAAQANWDLPAINKRFTSTVSRKAAASRTRP